MSFYRSLLSALSVLSVSIPLSAQVIAFDDFSTSVNPGDDAGDPLDLAWYGYGATNNSVSVVDGALENNPLTSGFRGVVGYFPTTVDLATMPVGQGIRVVFDIRALAAPASNTSGFRFGFHSANGARGTASLDSAFLNDTGYFGRLSWRQDAATGSNTGAVVRESGAEGPLGGTDNVSIAGSGTGGALFGGTTMQRFGFEVVRSSDTSVTLNIYQGNDLNLVYSAIDAASPQLTFDQVTIGLGSVVTGLRIDNVSVVQVIPEPSTYMLLGGSAAMLLIAARRRSARRSS